jgi:hypothetical protein
MGIRNFLKTSILCLIAGLFLFLSSCKDDDEDNDIVESETYNIDQVAGSGVMGTALFEKLSNSNTRITVELSGTAAGNTHPMHIHHNSASEGGGIAISLTSIDGSTGMSITNVTQLDNGTAITYEQLLDFDGYINVHLSATEMSTIVAQGDIGQNAP